MTKNNRTHLTPGDHIKVSRAPLPYAHHGIYVGRDEVIHFSGELFNEDEPSIRRDSLAKFADGGNVKVVEHEHRFSRSEAVRRAEKKLGEGRYSFLGNNCEHFAKWCATSEFESGQVEHRGIPAGSTATTIGAGAGGVAMVGSAGTVSGLSGAGLSTGLAAIGPGGMVGGAATLAGSAGLGAALLLNNTVLKDGANLPKEERKARKAGRVASYAGAGASAAAGVGAISAMGTTAGLSAAGISSGLAAIGTGTGVAAATGASAAVAGTAVVVAAPVVGAVGLGYGLYKAWKWLF